MAGKGAKMFRTQMGGFNKDDVNNYIKDTDLKHSLEIEKLTEKIAKLEAEIATVNEKCAALTEGNNFFHCFFCIIHKQASLYNPSIYKNSF